MIGIIGCGNMANAIVKGHHSKISSTKFITFDPTKEKSETLATSVGGKSANSLSDLNEASHIIIACKPQQFSQLSKDLADYKVNFSQKHVISIMAAMPLENIVKGLNCPKVTRVMPNTPIFLGEGMSLLLHSEDVSESERNFVQEFFSTCGEVADIKDEKTFNQVTAVSGSGPAYVFLFAKTMVDQLVNWGLKEDKARKIVIQLFKGSSDLMKERSDESLDDLIAQVTSKGGVTIEAVNSYKESGLSNISSKALKQAEKRSYEMIKEFRL